MMKNLSGYGYNIIYLKGLQLSNKSVSFLDYCQALCPFCVCVLIRCPFCVCVSKSTKRKHTDLEPLLQGLFTKDRGFCMKM